MQRPMWTARWGHALVTILNHSNVSNGTSHKLVLLGGDDYENWSKEGLLGFLGEICFTVQSQNFVSNIFSL